jgi:hypothetical protein
MEDLILKNANGSQLNKFSNPQSFLFPRNVISMNGCVCGALEPQMSFVWAVTQVTKL